jgi:lipoprotein signal peptidase
VVLGEVIDFIDVEFPNMHIPSFDIGFLQHAGVEMDRWPTFNVADSAVTVGIIILLFTLWRDPLFSSRTQVRQSTVRTEIPGPSF